MMKGDFDYLLGSSPDANIKINRDDIAPRHARLRRKGDRIFVQDLSSEFSVFVNGKRIPTKKWIQITRFDQLRLGSKVVELGPDVFLGRERLSVESTLLKLVSKNGITICDNVFLKAESGTLTAITGPSGCGKSVLLNILSGVYTPTGGSVFLGKRSIELHSNRAFVESFVGFVPQADILLPELTVEKSLDFKLRLKHPDMPTLTRNRLIRQVCERVGFKGPRLKKFLTTKIGTADAKGSFLSGGERRRANIAHELITQPLVLFLDEPTSGLSSFDSDEIVKTLKDLATNDGVTVICTIHQPSRQSFSCFDNLLVMNRGGKLHYHGPTNEIIDRFSSIHLDSTLNPCEAILTEVENGARPISTPRSFTPKPDAKKLNPKHKKEPNKTSLFTQTRILLARGLKIFTSDKENLWFTILQVPAIALLMIIAFDKSEQGHATADQFVRTIETFKSNAEELNSLSDRLTLAIDQAKSTQSPISESHANQIATVLFMLTLSSIWFGLLGSCKEIVCDQEIIKREMRSGIRGSAALCAKFLQCTIVASTQAFGLLLIVQPILINIEYESALRLASYLTLSTVAATALGLAISATANSYRTVMTIIPLAMIPQVLFGGLLRRLESSQFAPEAFSWFTLSRWSFQLNILESPVPTGGILALEEPVQLRTDHILYSEIVENITNLQRISMTDLYFGNNYNYLLPFSVLSSASLAFLIIAALAIKLNSKI